jgi:hypothetical protein
MSSKESLLALTSCQCEPVVNWASAVADEMSQETGSEAEGVFLDALDPDCVGMIDNPTNHCSTECSMPAKVCGHGKGPRFLVQKTIDIRL